MDDINKGDMIRAKISEDVEAYGFVVDIDTEAKKATVLVAVEVDLTGDEKPIQPLPGKREEYIEILKKRNPKERY